MELPDSDQEDVLEKWILDQTTIENRLRFTDVTGSFESNSAEFKRLGDEPLSYNIVGLTGASSVRFEPSALNSLQYLRVEVSWPSGNNSLHSPLTNKR
ncbi:hypothetical protein PG988_015473 [Apiospora saccharicola]